MTCIHDLITQFYKEGVGGAGPPGGDPRSTWPQYAGDGKPALLRGLPDQGRHHRRGHLSDGPGEDPARGGQRPPGLLTGRRAT